MKKFTERNIIWILLASVLLILGVASLFWFHASTWMKELADSGEIGDYFAGMLAPFVGLVGALLTFAAFYVQYQANKEQREAINITREANNIQREAILQQGEAIKRQEEELKRQQTQTMIDRFEQRFFEMLNIHRENVSHFKINVRNTSSSIIAQYEGNAAFQRAAGEIAYVYSIIKYCEDTSLSLIPKIPRGTAMYVTYSLVFWGFNTRILSSIDGRKFGFEAKDVSPFREFFSCLSKNAWPLHFSSYLDVEKLGIVVDKAFDEGKGVDFLKGFSGTWSHLYRHLFHTYTYLDQVADDVISPKLKYEYAKLLRAMLSEDEQKMLFYNCLAGFGEAWWENGLIEKYAPFKNIRLDELPDGLNPLGKLRNHLKAKSLPHDLEQLQWYFDTGITQKMLVSYGG